MSATPERPNILVVVIDSARAERFSCYGYDLLTTPHLDQFAAEGLRFDAAYAESSWTLPVCFTLMTGLAPREHQAELFRKLPEGMPTLPQVLAQHGYRTFCGSGNDFLSARTGLDTIFGTFVLAPHAAFWMQALLRYGPQRLGWTDWGGGTLTRQFLHWTIRAKQPWFALLWYNEPHHPYSARFPFTTRFCREALPLWRRLRLVKRMRRMLSLAMEMTDVDIMALRGLYDGCLAYVDSLFGDVRQGLERSGIWENTLVVVTADHGEMLGERGLLGHGRTANMYRPLLQIPLVVRFPDHQHKGTVSSALVQIADITYTLAAVVGGEGSLANTAAVRVDLREAAEGNGRPFAISERQPMGEKSTEAARRKSPNFHFEPHLQHMAAVVQDDWRLIYRTEGPTELYHLATDPHETRDLSADHPHRVATLSAIIANWQAHARPHPSLPDLYPVEQAIVEKRLQDLGYF